MADIGSTLREARMRSRIDITEVEKATKIRTKYLRALENEEWDLLPGPVYVKSFLRTYGDYLGLDSRMLTDEFKHRYERPADHDARPMSSLARERDRRVQPRRRLPPWVPIVAVIAVVVGILYAVGSATTNNSNPPATQTTHHPATAHRHKKATPPAAPARPRQVTLRLVPTGTVYVCLVNGGGRKLINAQNYTVGQTIPTEKANHLLLTLGNNAIKVTVNGHSVPVAPSASAIRLLIAPKGVMHIPLSQKPSCP
ncbi:MAG: helix-turn-helix domain-containing protein [Solirubrobacteraceae bacterium]